MNRRGRFQERFQIQSLIKIPSKHLNIFFLEKSPRTPHFLSGEKNTTSVPAGSRALFAVERIDGTFNSIDLIFVYGVRPPLL